MERGIFVCEYAGYILLQAFQVCAIVAFACACACDDVAVPCTYSDV